ncbi:MAG TPA: hypothetical protein VN856_16360 [Mycobacterium sp.]|nr:hypothetical protein [Mycobacterium sp.]HXO81451.1 hypothetical protein [Mycobacterium sp.]
MTVNAELVARLQELSDRAEIHDCMQRYARGPLSAKRPAAL